MKRLLVRGPLYLFRGLRLGQPFVAALGAALVMRRLMAGSGGGREKIASRQLDAGDEITIRVER